MRPIAIWPRGNRQTRRVAQTHLLACPRLSPDFEMSALRVLCKPRPERRESIIHRTGLQHWNASSKRSIQQVAETLATHVGPLPDLHFPKLGDYRFLAQF